MTVSDDGYFIGTVGLFNSLRLTGNNQPVVVIDLGLTVAQRELLSNVCEVRPPPVGLEGRLPVFIKATLGLLGLQGTVALIDSDMIVTSALGSILDEASAGRICAFVDEPVRDRQFPEWAEALELRAELRPQPYVNSGFLALEADRWSGLLRRWWELSARISAERSRLPQIAPDRFALAFGFPEQDVLNAILMSETPTEEIFFLRGALAPTPLENPSTRVLDRQQLICANGTVRAILLHHLWHPKPWSRPSAATRLYFGAYVDLLARVLTADDVPLRLRSGDIPLWLRDGPAGRLTRGALYRAGQIARRGLRHVPQVGEGPIRRIARAIVPPERHG